MKLQRTGEGISGLATDIPQYVEGMSCIKTKSGEKLLVQDYIDGFIGDVRGYDVRFEPVKGGTKAIQKVGPTETMAAYSYDELREIGKGKSTVGARLLGNYLRRVRIRPGEQKPLAE